MLLLFITEKAIGSSCVRDIECAVTNSVCASGTCVCNTGDYLDGEFCLNSKLVTAFSFCYYMRGSQKVCDRRLKTRTKS